MCAVAYRDENDVPTVILSSNVDGKTPVRWLADPVTGRALVDISGGGGASIAMQQVTAVQSGNNVTIDLNQLSNTFISIIMVTDQGQVLDTNRWSVIGSTMTVTNTFDSDSFQIQYTF